jgi:hypothetical protein
MTRTCITCHRNEDNCECLQGIDLTKDEYIRMTDPPKPRENQFPIRHFDDEGNLIKPPQEPKKGFTEEEADEIIKALNHRPRRVYSYREEEYSKIDNPPPKPEPEQQVIKFPWVGTFARAHQVCGGCKRIMSGYCDYCGAEIHPEERIRCLHKKYCNAVKHYCQKCAEEKKENL